jgi:hypothetical protein
VAQVEASGGGRGEAADVGGGRRMRSCAHGRHGKTRKGRG